MKSAGIQQNTARIQSVNRPSSYRIPDGLTSQRLIEVKNVQYQSWSSQLRDYSAIAQRDGLQFVLKVNNNAQLSGPLRVAREQGKVIIDVY